MSESNYAKEHPRIKKFNAVLEQTLNEIRETYKQEAFSEETLEYVLRHAESTIKQFQAYFYRVSDLHRIIKYVKIKRTRFGRERIEYSYMHRLPDHNEALIEACLMFLRNYYGEMECMKILLRA